MSMEEQVTKAIYDAMQPLVDFDPFSEHMAKVAARAAIKVVEEYTIDAKEAKT